MKAIGIGRRRAPVGIDPPKVGIDPPRLTGAPPILIGKREEDNPEQCFLQNGPTRGSSSCTARLLPSPHWQAAENPLFFDPVELRYRKQLSEPVVGYRRCRADKTV
jgi:hypothetical protein